MGLITIQPIGQSTFRLSMARGLQHISDMLKSLIEVPGERIWMVYTKLDINVEVN